MIVLYYGPTALLLFLNHPPGVIISSHHEQGSSTFWSTVMKMQLQSYGPTCWKFCHVLHKLMREGHKNVIFDSMKYLTWLDDLGNNWVSLFDLGHSSQ